MSKRPNKPKANSRVQSPTSHRMQLGDGSPGSLAKGPRSSHEELMFVASLAPHDDPARDRPWPATMGGKPPQTTLSYIHVRRDLVEAGAALQTIIDDINRIVRERGAIVLASGQILRVPLLPIWDLDTHFDDYSSSPDVHEHREWTTPQRKYFGSLWGVTNPFQYSEKPLAYDQYAINVRVHAPYLTEGERILALVDADRDGMRFYCPCHSADVVYTSAHRLVCMGCGQLHCVLADSIQKSFGRGVSAADWDAFFDEEGELIDEDATLHIVDFQELESASKIWTTDAWAEASRKIEFFARASVEERERYKGSVVTPDMLIAAGFTHVSLPPPPALQFGEMEYAVDLGTNAAAAVSAGATAYARSKADPGQLRDAVLHLFQAIELLLKIRLDGVTPGKLDRHPNNPSVLRALEAQGVKLTNAENETVRSLRQLRNKLQHGEARLSYRRTRVLLRRSLVFIDRFVLDELEWWLGDVVSQPAWDALLAIEPVRQNAVRVADESVSRAIATPDYIVEACTRCERNSLIGTPNDGSRCVYCGHRPTVEDLYPEDFG